MSFYVTTPIYYVNAEPHIGHVYSTLIADVFARWYRQQYRQRHRQQHRQQQEAKTAVHFLTGTDEHGQKIQEKAEELGLTPQQLVDLVAARFQGVFDQFDFSYDRFIRTTEPQHVQTVKSVWEQLTAKGLIYQGQYEGWYSVSDETFYPLSETVERTNSTGETQRFAQASGKALIWHQEANYLFRLSQFTEPLLRFYREHPDWIVPSTRLTEVETFVASGLRDLSVSRQRSTCQWGIEVPTDDGQTVYVWLDALTNYLTGTRSSVSHQSGADDHDPSTIVNPDWWPADVHVIGKDILRFHAVYWPAFLLALELPLPKRLVVHGWWTMNGEKIAKSTGNVFDPVAKSQEYGNDCLRYYLLRDTTFASDGDFSDQRMVTRINTELADSLGNLVSRIFSPSLLIFSQIPEGSEYFAWSEQATELDQEVVEQGKALIETLTKLIERECHFQRSLDTLWHFIDRLNGYINANAPWRAKREECKERYYRIMYVLLESIRLVAELLQAFLPDTSRKILALFPPVSEPLQWGQLKSGDRLNGPQSVILFPKERKSVLP